MAKNRTCFICGNKYDYCPTCDRDRLKPSWYALFCSNACHDLNDILAQNTAGKLSLEDANERLKHIDFNIEHIKNDIVTEHINKILNYKKETSKKKDSVSVQK